MRAGLRILKPETVSWLRRELRRGELSRAALLALDLSPGFRPYTSQTLFEQLLCAAAAARLERERCTVCFKKKRNLPVLLEAFQSVPDTRIPWLGDHQLAFDGASRSKHRWIPIQSTIRS